MKYETNFVINQNEFIDLYKNQDLHPHSIVIENSDYRKIQNEIVKIAFLNLNKNDLKDDFLYVFCLYEYLKDYNLLNEMLDKLIDNDFVYAHYYKGLCYKYGYGIEQNLELAFKHFKIGYEANDVCACYEYGLIVIETDEFAGKKILDICEKVNYPEALNKIGEYFLEGEYFPKNEELGKDFFRRAALQKNFDALYNIGVQMIKEDKKASLISALGFFDYIAKRYHAKAIYMIGHIYETTPELGLSPIDAVEWYKKSAELNCFEAIFALGRCYEEGIGVKKDLEKSFAYYESLINDDYPNACYKVGCFYFNGIVVDEDKKKALNFFEKAALKENSESINMLGYYYENGIVVKKDLEKAYEYYKKSAELENSEALKNIGLFYEQGIVVEQSNNEAFNYYKKSAELNNSEAQNYLGQFYFNGIGVEQDEKIALYWFIKGAKNNNISAAFNAAICYEEGIGTFVDYGEAVKYYKIAASKDDQDALKKIDTFKKNIFGKWVKKQ